MSTIAWQEDRRFPSVLHVKRGNEIKRYVPERTARLEYDDVHCDYVCTACGELYYTMMYETVVSEDLRMLLKPMRFCPNCGARVMEVDE